jgi:formylglycine-generating enzyme required for sulfatase activity
MSIDRRVSWLVVGFLAACSASGSKGASTAGEEAANTVRVPGSSSVVSLIELPEGSRTRLSATEIPWEAYDAFVFRLDEKDPTLPPDADAAARPSQPYITMDHAFGHAGFPVISVSYLGAQAFCEWLSRKSGRRFRLPTEAEWELAARAGGEPIDLGATAWTLETSGGPKTHAIGSKLPNVLGFHDLLGNAAEWCTAPDGTGVVRGGSYLDSAEDDLFALRRPYERAWNKSDPQIPKSKWWLADAPFIGFRVVCEE